MLSIALWQRYVLRVRQKAVEDWLQRNSFYPETVVDSSSSEYTLPTDSADVVVEQQIETPDKDFMQRVTKTVVAHMGDSSFSVNDLASELKVSRTTLFEMLKKEQVTASRLIREIRLVTAHQLLLEQPDLPLNEIAERCGFKDYSSFWRSYRNRYGVSPRDSK